MSAVGLCLCVFWVYIHYRNLSQYGQVLRQDSFGTPRVGAADQSITRRSFTRLLFQRPNRPHLASLLQGMQGISSAQ